jgi:purine-cytosine permease-like protein
LVYKQIPALEIMEKQGKAERWVWGITIFLVLIGIAIVVRRLTFLSLMGLSGNTVPVKSRVPDDGFAAHPQLTLIHIAAGLLFVLLAPLQFVKRIKDNYPKIHRTTGYVVLISGLIIGVTALIMGAIMAVGGITETLAVTTFGVLSLFSLMRAYLYILKREFDLHREWMIRVLAIGLAVTTTRPIMGIFFATSKLTGLTVQQFFGIAFWIAFILHISFAEYWIRKTRKKYYADMPPMRVV